LALAKKGVPCNVMQCGTGIPSFLVNHEEWGVTAVQNIKIGDESQNATLWFLS